MSSKVVPVWDWIPEKFRPRCVCGPDICMRDSVYRYLRREHPNYRVTRCDQPGPSSLVCPPMGLEEKKRFLENQCHRLGYKLGDPHLYLHLVTSLESVEMIMCLDMCGILETCEDERGSASQPDALERERIARMGLPRRVAELIIKYGYGPGD